LKCKFSYVFAGCFRTIRLEPPMAEVHQSPAPSPEELLRIVDLKSAFPEEFSKELSERHPAYYSDIALTRVLRGNDGDMDKAKDWFVKFLKFKVDLDLSSVVTRADEIFRRSLQEGRRLNSADIPHWDEIEPYVGKACVFSCERLSRAGDVVYYCPLVQTDHAGILANVAWDKYTEHMLFAVVLRSVELQHLSEEQGRLVQHELVIDCYGTHSLSDVYHSEYQEKFDATIGPFITGISVETVSNIWFVNVPWFAERAYYVMRETALQLDFVPQRVMDKVHVLLSNGCDDPDVLRHLAPEDLAWLYARRGACDDADPGLDGTVTVSTVFERTLQAAPGGKVSWQFKVEEGSAWLGSADLQFSVEALYDSARDKRELQRTTIVESYMVTAEDGEQFGHCVPENSGLLLLVWSNEHSWLRSKDLQFKIVTQ